MKKLHIITCLTFACCTLFAQKKILICYDKDFDFSSLKTFDFSESSYKLGQKFKKQPYIAKVLIEKLAEKGFQKIRGESDAIVDVGISLRKIINVKRDPHMVYFMNNVAPSAGGKYNSPAHTTSQEEERKACLVINVIDHNTGQTVWSGVWLGELYLDLKPGKRKKKIDKAISKMLKKYPLNVK